MTHPTTEQIAARGKPIIPFPGQSFANKREWIARAKYVLTAHPEYHNTEHDGPSKGWRGNHFTALCYDQKGRRVRRGGDFQSAEDDDAFPVWWVWPDQIPQLAEALAAPAGVKVKPLVWLDRAHGLKWAIDPFGGAYTLDGDNWTHDSMSGWLGGGADGAQADCNARIIAAHEPAPSAGTFADGLEAAMKACVALRHSDDLDTDEAKIGAMYCALAISQMKQAAIRAMTPEKPHD